MEPSETRKDKSPLASVSRRTFLKLLAAGVSGFLAARLFDFLAPKTIETQTSTVTATVTKTITATTTVGPASKSAGVVMVRGAPNVGPQALVDKALELLGGVEKLVPMGASILVKPNVGFYEKDAVTDPEITAAVIRSLKRAKPTRVVVGESSVRGYDTEHALRVTGTRNQAEEAGAEVRDLRNDPAVSVDLPKGRAITSADVFKTVRDSSYVVNVSRLKRHSATVTTICLKNMMGTVPDSEKGRFHQVNLSQCIADLNSVIRPNLAIVDATKAMTKRGPTGGTMVGLNLVIASLDPVAADAVAAEELFKAEGVSDPRGAVSRIEHIQKAAELGIGVADRSRIEVLDVTLS